MGEATGLDFNGYILPKKLVEWESVGENPASARPTLYSEVPDTSRRQDKKQNLLEAVTYGTLGATGAHISDMCTQTHPTKSLSGTRGGSPHS